MVGAAGLTNGCLPGARGQGFLRQWRQAALRRRECSSASRCRNYADFGVASRSVTGRRYDGNLAGALAGQLRQRAGRDEGRTQQEHRVSVPRPGPARRVGRTGATRAKAGAVVEICSPPTSDRAPLPSGNDLLILENLAIVADRRRRPANVFVRRAPVTPNPDDIIQLVEMQVVVTVDLERIDVYDELGADPQQKRDIGKILQKDDPEDENAVVWLDYDPT